MNKQYIYTTESDRKKGRYKYGGVFSDRSAESRVKDQQTGNSEKLEIVGVFISEYSDHYVHEELIKLGYHRLNIGGKEWFQGFKSDDEAIATLGRIVSNSNTAILDEYAPRFYQDYIKMVFEEKLKKCVKGRKEFALE
jgi:hypothetical protein